MRRSVAVGGLVLVLAFWTAPSAIGQEAPAERVILDAAVRVPAFQSTSLCMEIEPGVLTTTAQSVGDPNMQIGLNLGPDGSGTFPGEYINSMVPTAPATFKTVVRQPVTCFGLMDQTNPQVFGVRKVALKVVWSPQ